MFSDTYYAGPSYLFYPVCMLKFAFPDNYRLIPFWFNCFIIMSTCTTLLHPSVPGPATSPNARWFALLIVSSAAFLSVVDLFIVNVALPAIRTGIRGTAGDMQLVIALYLLGHAIFLITGSRFGDLYGRKKIFLWSMLLFTAASAACGLAQTAAQLNTARFLQGAMAAFMVPQSIAYIQVMFPEAAARARALGIYGAIAGTASVLGQFLGGLLPSWDGPVAGWRLLFLVNVPFGLVAAFAAWRWLPVVAAQHRGRADLSGIVWLSLGLTLLLYPLIRGREMGWPLWSLLALPASLLLLRYFCIDQRRKQLRGRPYLIDLQLFAIRDFNRGLLAVIAYFIVQDSYFLLNTIYLQSAAGLPPVTTGYYFVLQGIGYVAASLASMHLVARYGKRVLQAGVLLMIAMLLAHMALLPAMAPQDAPPQPHRWIFPVLFFYGMGCGTVLPSLLTMALHKIPPALAGAAAGTYVTLQQVAIALGICLIGGLFFQLAGAAPTLAQWHHAYRWATGVNMLFLGLTAWFLQRMRR